ncbi:lipopolysaccharide biosynthesis protein [Rhodococcus pyridinivorans]|uniref:lipopolysaccharide biosynthesis protein n=1 Tax=Rhodococcus pyridinivorans TaxID=103816 RepID=UPI000934BCDE|nr:oligosaccharide flippase family protein [Rhodococcus pyridinivorans]
MGKHARTRRNSFSDRVWSGSNRRGYVANRISGDKIRSIVLYALGPALGILSGPILARAMGPDGRGQFASIMQPITIASAIASIGIPSAIAVYIARGNSPRRCYQIGLTTAMLPTIIIVVAMVFYGRVVSERQNIPYATILLCWTAIVLSVVVQIRRGAWQGVGRWRLLDVERGGAAVARFVFVLIVALLGLRSAESFAAGALLSFVLVSCMLFIPLPKSNGSASPATGDFARFSILASVGTIATIASSRLDQLLMPIATDASQLGFYAVAVTVAEVPLIFGTLAARNALQLSAAGKNLRTIARESSMFFWAGSISAVVILLCADWIVPIVFGDDFQQSVLAIKLLALGSIFTWVMLVTSAVISGRGRPGLGSAIALSSLLFTIVAFLIFWTAMSSTTAAAIALASSIVAATLGVVLTARVRAVPRPDESTSTVDKILPGQAT